MKSMRRMSVLGGIVFSVVVMTSWNTTWAQNLAISQGVAILISDDNESISAYCTETGKWITQKVSPAKGEVIVPSVLRKMACCQVGDKLYAFSAQTGEWGQLELDSKEKVNIEISASFIIAHNKNQLHGFAASKGVWKTIDIKLAPFAEKQTSSSDFMENAAYVADAAFFTINNHLYAFSGLTGNWDSINFKNGK